jgi:hypothetical protein
LLHQVAGFLNGPGFQKMRADLRREADEVFVVDCTPEGHQPPVGSRIFQGVQQPVCIVLALRLSAEKSEQPAIVHFRSLADGSRESKFQELVDLTIDDEAWVEAPSEWRAPFLPAGTADWIGYPALEDLFKYNGSGAMAGRTWVIAPDAVSLRNRWKRLRDEPDAELKAKLFHPHEGGDRTIKKIVREALSAHPHPASSVAVDKSEGADPIRYSFRSFDRQWILPDNRLINRANPQLWKSASSNQVYLTAPHDRTPTKGPALTVAGLIPDLHHYHGRGGRAFPLWADAAASEPNLPDTLLTELSAVYGRAVTGPDLFAYTAAIAASPAYTERFRANLKQPGLRIPITALRALFEDGVELGREVVWLHTFGERFNEGRPAGPPRVDKDEPTIPAGGALPSALADMPHELDYDAASRKLKIGAGFVAEVSPDVWAYEVSGKNVLSQWWSYRRRDRSKPPMGDRRPPSRLSEIQPTIWPAEYTTELLALLRVLTRLVALESRQANLLSRIVDGPTIDSDTLSATGSLSEASAEAPETSGDEEG